MNIGKLDESVYVTGQIREQDLAEIARNGVRTVVNNRPDGEEPGQPASATLEEAAGRLGLHYVYFPVVGGMITPQQVNEFRALRESIEAPALLFCRTGARCMQLWQLCDAG